MNIIEKNNQKFLERSIFYLFLLFVLLTGYVFIFLGFYWTIAGILTKKGLVDVMGSVVGHDFSLFYTASKIARSGDPSLIYSVSTLNETMISIIGTHIGKMAWNYPPTFLLLILPLSSLPYVFSLIVWIIGTLCGYLWIIRKIIPLPIAPWLFLGFPTAVHNLFAGQNGFLSTILLGGGLLLLDSNPFLGGVLLGILSYKPQLFVLLPIALLAGRYWRALWGLVVGVSGLITTSLIVFGYKTWVAFFGNTYFAATHWQTKHLLVKIPTIFAASQLAGTSVSTAIIFQAITILIVISIVILVWFKRVQLPLRGAILSLCIPLATPYLFQYDLAIISLAYAWLGWMIYNKGNMRELGLLIICWYSLFFSIFDNINFQLTPIILIVLLLFTVIKWKLIRIQI